MEATENPATPQATVHCRAVLPSGRSCRGGLWRPLQHNLIEISHRLPGGRRWTQVLPLRAAQETLIACPDCGAHWWPASATEPRQMATLEAALQIIRQRPRGETAQILDHLVRDELSA